MNDISITFVLSLRDLKRIIDIYDNLIEIVRCAAMLPDGDDMLSLDATKLLKDLGEIE